MSSNLKINKASNSAAAVALLGLIPIFLFIITYGWQKIFEGLGVLSDYSLIQYIIAFLIATVGVVFARMVAAERLRIKFSDNPHSRGVWIAYFALLFLVSALGSMNTLYVKLESRSALQDAFRVTNERLSDLRQAISSEIITTEYDMAKRELEMQKTSFRKAFAEFLVLADKDKNKQRDKLEDFKRKASSAWEQFEFEMRNPARPGFGREAKKRFEELQNVLPELRELAGSFETNQNNPNKINELIIRYRQNFDNIVSRRNEDLSTSCSFSGETVSKLNALREKIPEIRPLPESNIKCIDLDVKLSQWTSDFEAALNRMSVQQSPAESIRVNFKQTSDTEIKRITDEISAFSIDQNKISTDTARPFLEAQWRSYEKLFQEFRSLHPNVRAISVPNQIVIPEVRYIGQIGNVLELFLKRWDHLSTYLILLIAVSFDVILITFYSRYLRGKMEDDDSDTNTASAHKSNGSAKIL